MQAPDWEKKGRLLTQLLIWSGAINIGLLSSLIYISFQKRDVSFVNEPVVSEHKRWTNQDILRTFSTLSWNELVDHLGTLELIEDGYTKRDLALSSLVAFHGLDIEKALLGTTVQKRRVTFSRREGPEEISVMLYPGMTEDQFRAVIHFVQTEKFPLTAQGLFYEIQQSTPPRDPALLQTFYLTQEFNALLTLCQRAGINLPREFLIEMITQGDWQTLYQFAQEQREQLDLSPERLKKLLLSYIKCRSLFAAKILLQWDKELLLKQLDDQHLVAFLDLFKESSPLLEVLLKELITSPRSDIVWKKAAERLYLFAQKPFPEPYDHRLTLATFAGVHVSPPRKPPPALQPTAQERKHVVQKGENLWKIARRYKVPIETLRQANHLESDKIREGKTLIIPAIG